MSSSCDAQFIKYAIFFMPTVNGGAQEWAPYQKEAEELLQDLPDVEESDETTIPYDQAKMKMLTVFDQGTVENTQKIFRAIFKGVKAEQNPSLEWQTLWILSANCLKGREFSDYSLMYLRNRVRAIETVRVMMLAFFNNKQFIFPPITSKGQDAIGIEDFGGSNMLWGINFGLDSGYASFRTNDNQLLNFKVLHKYCYGGRGKVTEVEEQVKMGDCAFSIFYKYPKLEDRFSQTLEGRVTISKSDNAPFDKDQVDQLITRLRTTVKI